MKTEPHVITQREILPIPFDATVMECPLHLTMEEIAHVAVKQHVLYLEGECQPRPDLLKRLETWSALDSLIRSRICVASRASRITSSELEDMLDGLLPVGTDSAIPHQQSSLRAALGACARATSCPLGTLFRE